MAAVFYQITFLPIFDEITIWRRCIFILDFTLITFIIIVSIKTFLFNFYLILLICLALTAEFNSINGQIRFVRAYLSVLQAFNRKWNQCSFLASFRRQHGQLCKNHIKINIFSHEFYDFKKVFNRFRRLIRTDLKNVISGRSVWPSVFSAPTNLPALDKLCELPFRWHLALVRCPTDRPEMTFFKICISLGALYIN